MPAAIRLPTRESLAAARARGRKTIPVLRPRSPAPRVPWRHETPLQLLVATILSAQCTDAMVNRVTPALFQHYRAAAAFANADPRELEGLIRPTGFFRQKTKAIMAASHTLVERFGGEVPSTMEELLMLEGVGRKTANVILGGYYGVPGVVVDTHVRRLSQRLGLTGQDDPEKIEQDLMRFIPREEWSAFSLRLIFFGREICTARNPRCPVCPLNRLCPSAEYRGAPPGVGPPPPGGGAAGRTGGRVRPVDGARCGGWPGGRSGGSSYRRPASDTPGTAGPARCRGGGRKTSAPGWRRRGCGPARGGPRGGVRRSKTPRRSPRRTLVSSTGTRRP